jgi:hypothetical protein
MKLKPKSNAKLKLKLNVNINLKMKPKPKSELITWRTQLETTQEGIQTCKPMHPENG